MPKAKPWTDRPLLPPRLREWAKGERQVGVFLRTVDGGSLQMTKNKASEDDQLFCLAIIHGIHKMSPEVIATVRAEVDRVSKEKGAGR